MANISDLFGGNPKVITWSNPPSCALEDEFFDEAGHRIAMYSTLLDPETARGGDLWHVLRARPRSIVCAIRGAFNIQRWFIDFVTYAPVEGKMSDFRRRGKEGEGAIDTDGYRVGQRKIQIVPRGRTGAKKPPQAGDEVLAKLEDAVNNTFRKLSTYPCKGLVTKIAVSKNVVTMDAMNRMTVASFMRSLIEDRFEIFFVHHHHDAIKGILFGSAYPMVQPSYGDIANMVLILLHGNPNLTPEDIWKELGSRAVRVNLSVVQEIYGRARMVPDCHVVHSRMVNMGFKVDKKKVCSVMSHGSPGGGPVMSSDEFYEALRRAGIGTPPKKEKVRKPKKGEQTEAERGGWIEFDTEPLIKPDKPKKVRAPVITKHKTRKLFQTSPPSPMVLWSRWKANPGLPSGLEVIPVESYQWALYNLGLPTNLGTEQLRWVDTNAILRLVREQYDLRQFKVEKVTSRTRGVGEGKQTIKKKRKEPAFTTEQVVKADERMKRAAEAARILDLIRMGHMVVQGNARVPTYVEAERSGHRGGWSVTRGEPRSPHPLEPESPTRRGSVSEAEGQRAIQRQREIEEAYRVIREVEEEKSRKARRGGR